MNPDPMDAFYQQLDSDRLLKQFAPELGAEARNELPKNPSGFITEPDAADDPVVREIVTKLSGGKAPPVGLMVGNRPRAFVERDHPGVVVVETMGWDEVAVVTAFDVAAFKARTEAA